MKIIEKDEFMNALCGEDDCSKCSFLMPTGCRLGKLIDAMPDEDIWEDGEKIASFVLKTAEEESEQEKWNYALNLFDKMWYVALYADKHFNITVMEDEVRFEVK